MKSLKIISMLGLLFLLPAAARADHWDHHDRRNWNEGLRQPDHNWDEHRGGGWDSVGPRFERGGSREDEVIQRGIRSGQLSPDEVRKLRSEERTLRQDERSEWADGHLSHAEKKNLDKEKRDLDRDLNHQLNDDEHGRGGSPFHWW